MATTTTPNWNHYCPTCGCRILSTGVDLHNLTHTLTRYYPDGVTVKGAVSHPVVVKP
jgi:hypothetical protein